jgi:hypothetical protein
MLLVEGQHTNYKLIFVLILHGHLQENYGLTIKITQYPDIKSKKHLILVHGHLFIG